MVARGPSHRRASGTECARCISMLRSQIPGGNCLQATEGRPERRIAIQEYGKPKDELIAGLRREEPK